MLPATVTTRLGRMKLIIYLKRSIQQLKKAPHRASPSVLFVVVLSYDIVRGSCSKPAEKGAQGLTEGGHKREVPGQVSIR